MDPLDDYDVIVLGSGAAGLTAAFTAARRHARVALIEKNSRLGGTSAWSGGYVWVPANHHMPTGGHEDTVDEGVRYLTAIGRGEVDETLVRTVVEAGPRMIAFLEQEGGLEFYSVPGLPDYHPEHPGGRPEGGRTLGLPMFRFPELGEWADRVEVTPYYPIRYRMNETGIGAAIPVLPTDEELERRTKADERGGGGALIGPLVRACLDAGVGIELDTRATELVLRDGRIAGVVAEGPEGARTISARSVILATGGFEWDEELRAAYLRGPIQQPASIPTNTGDGLRMAMRVGAALQNMHEAWWIPIVALPPGVNGMDLEMVNNDRSRAGSIMVNRTGRRFVNEAANYNAMGGAFHNQDPTSFDYLNIPVWIIHDHAYLERFGSLGRPYDGRTPPWLTEGATLSELAEKLGIPATELEATVARWNAAVDEGRDVDFHRGESAHDRWWGDPDLKGDVAATLGPLVRAPFYAMELRPGALGTKGGPKVDDRARVIDIDGRVIDGLYAVGNASSPSGPGYGGVGGTHGPNMTWAWIAAIDATPAASTAGAGSRQASLRR